METFNPKLENLLCIDPGDHTGWAWFTDGKATPFKTGQINLSRSKDLVSMEDQLFSMWIKFDDLLEELQPSHVIIEGVEYWAGSAKSQAAANRQNLFKLAYLAGGYGWIVKTYAREFGFLTARQWKGQLSKEAVAYKVRELTGKTYPSDHVTDAVGIGLAFAGLIKHDTKASRKGPSK